MRILSHSMCETEKNKFQLDSKPILYSIQNFSIALN